MVSSQQCDVGRILDFITHKQFESLDRVESSINKVPDEDIVLVRDFSTDPEQLEQIIKLSMNVSTNCDRS